MPCRPILDAAGNHIGFACGPRQRTKPCKCGRPSTVLCDFELTGPKQGKTCDAPLCPHCATHIGKNRDLCPIHAAMQKAPKS